MTTAGMVGAGTGYVLGGLLFGQLGASVGMVLGQWVGDAMAGCPPDSLGAAGDS